MIILKSVRLSQETGLLSWISFARLATESKNMSICGYSQLEGTRNSGAI